jgi:hypothetical protein
VENLRYHDNFLFIVPFHRCVDLDLNFGYLIQSNWCRSSQSVMFHLPECQWVSLFSLQLPKKKF